MSQSTEGFNTAKGFNVTTPAPLDTRCKVDTVAHLTDASWWAQGGAYLYKGLLVTVNDDSEENNGVYRLKTVVRVNGLVDPTQCEWEKVGATEDVGNIEVVDSLEAIGVMDITAVYYNGEAESVDANLKVVYDTFDYNYIPDDTTCRVFVIDSATLALITCYDYVSDTDPDGWRGFPAASIEELSAQVLFATSDITARAVSLQNPTKHVAVFDEQGQYKEKTLYVKANGATYWKRTAAGNIKVYKYNGRTSREIDMLLYVTDNLDVYCDRTAHYLSTVYWNGSDTKVFLIAENSDIEIMTFATTSEYETWKASYSGDYVIAFVGDTPDTFTETSLGESKLTSGVGQFGQYYLPSSSSRDARLTILGYVTRDEDVYNNMIYQQASCVLVDNDNNFLRISLKTSVYYLGDVDYEYFRSQYTEGVIDIVFTTEEEYDAFGETRPSSTEEGFFIYINDPEFTTYDKREDPEFAVYHNNTLINQQLPPLKQGIGANSVIQRNNANNALGQGSAAFGNGNTVIGQFAAAFGANNYVNLHAYAAFVTGENNEAQNTAELATGTYNDSQSGTLFTVGNGVDQIRRNNALQVNANGDVYLGGKRQTSSYTIPKLCYREMNGDFTDIIKIIRYLTPAATYAFTFSAAGTDTYNAAPSATTKSGTLTTAKSFLGETTYPATTVTLKKSSKTYGDASYADDASYGTITVIDNNTCNGSSYTVSFGTIGWGSYKFIFTDSVSGQTSTYQLMILKPLYYWMSSAATAAAVVTSTYFDKKSKITGCQFSGDSYATSDTGDKYVFMAVPQGWAPASCKVTDAMGSTTNAMSLVTEGVQVGDDATNLYDIYRTAATWQNITGLTFAFTGSSSSTF